MQAPDVHHGLWFRGFWRNATVEGRDHLCKWRPTAWRFHLSDGHTFVVARPLLQQRELAKWLACPYRSWSHVVSGKSSNQTVARAFGASPGTANHLGFEGNQIEQRRRSTTVVRGRTTANHRHVCVPRWDCRLHMQRCCEYDNPGDLQQVFARNTLQVPPWMAWAWSNVPSVSS